MTARTEFRTLPVDNNAVNLAIMLGNTGLMSTHTRLGVVECASARDARAAIKALLTVGAREICVTVTGSLSLQGRPSWDNFTLYGGQEVQARKVGQRYLTIIDPDDPRRTIKVEPHYTSDSLYRGRVLVHWA